MNSTTVTERVEINSGGLQSCVGVVSAAPRDRIEHHIAEGCSYCSTAGEPLPGDAIGWKPIDAWERRWRIVGFPVEEATRWTELTRCNPEIAIALRAAGITPDDIERYYEKRYSGTPETCVADLVDPILLWLSSGFSWLEIERIAPDLFCPFEVVIARELRLRGVSNEDADREIIVDGEKKFLWDFLFESFVRDGHELSLEEKLAWLEERDIVSRWAA